MKDFKPISGPGGTIWKTGVHNVGVNGKGTKLYSPQYSLLQLADLMERIIESEGGIPIGFGDHVPEEVISSYPMLKKLDLHNVGTIKAVETDGESIKIKESEIHNPAVAELYEKGELPAYSIVARFQMAPCPDNKADMVVDYFTKFNRVDFVARGGCEACKVEQDSDNYSVINAKFMEVLDMTEEQRNDTQEQEEEVEASFELTEEVKTFISEEIKSALTELTATEEEVEEEETEEEEEQNVEASLPEDVKERLARVDELELEAKKAKIDVMLTAAFKEGKAIPAMRENLEKIGLADEEALKELLASLPDGLVDFSENGTQEETEDKLTVEKALKKINRA